MRHKSFIPDGRSAGLHSREPSAEWNGTRADERWSPDEGAENTHFSFNLQQRQRPKLSVKIDWLEADAQVIECHWDEVEKRHWKKSVASMMED